MRKWLYDNPWIWIVVFFGFLVTSSLVVLVIAELNKPEIVKVTESHADRGVSISARIEAR